MWWQTYPKRYAYECRQMEQYFPAASVVHGEIPGRYCPACVRLPDQGAIVGGKNPPHLAVFARMVTPLGRVYPVILVYPCTFPNRIPGVWPLEPLYPQPPSHQFADGRLCLVGTEANPALSGVTILSWAFGWLTCYDIWRTTGVFLPGNYGQHNV